MIHSGDCFSVYNIMFIIAYKDDVNLQQKVITCLLMFYSVVALLTTPIELCIVFQVWACQNLIEKK